MILVDIERGSYIIQLLFIILKTQRTEGHFLNLVKVTSWRSTPNIEWIYIPLRVGFPGSSVVNNPSAMQETRVPSLGREDPLEKEMATHSSVFA